MFAARACEKIRKHANRRVHEQDVPKPKEIRVDRAKQHHEKLPAIVDAAEFRTDSFRPAGHQDDARAEQHREYAQEFLMNKNVCKKPGAKIERVCATHEQWVGVGRERHRERVNVHDQDAED